jgi:hypothetical protein
MRVSASPGEYSPDSAVAVRFFTSSGAYRISLFVRPAKRRIHGIPHPLVPPADLFDRRIFIFPNLYPQPAW